MRRILRRKPSPAMGVALIALFISLGGVSYGVATGSIDSRELKNNTVRSKDIRNSTVLGKDVRNNTVKGADVDEGTLGTVPSANTANSAPPSGPAGGDLTGNFPNPLVGNDKITSTQIAADAVGASEIAPDAVGGSELGTVTTRSATSASIADNASGSASVQCLPGEQVLSGGNDGFTSEGYFVVANRFASPNGWSVFLRNDTGGAITITVRARCLAP